MERPGIGRAISGAIIGLALGALFVYGIRRISGFEPYWDTGLALVVWAFSVMGGWMWGMGAFNPKLSEHGDPHEEAAIVPVQGADVAAPHAPHTKDEEPTPTNILMNQIWKVTSATLIIFFAVFAFANLPRILCSFIECDVVPTWLLLQVTDDPEASFAAIDPNTTFAYPFGLGEFQASQLTVFLGFVAFTILSLVIFAGLIGFAFYYGHQNLAEVQESEPTAKQLTPPPPVRMAGRVSKNIGRSLREGLPKFFGIK